MSVLTIETNGCLTFHSIDQVGLRRFDDQVKMISHQTISMHPPLGLQASLAQCIDETFAVFVIAKNLFPPIPAIRDACLAIASSDGG